MEKNIVVKIAMSDIVKVKQTQIINRIDIN